MKPGHDDKNRAVALHVDQFGSWFCAFSRQFLPGKDYHPSSFYVLGGGFCDLRAQAVLPFLQKHLRKNPTVVIDKMDRVGGRKGANHLYRSVGSYGPTIGAASGAIVGLAVMGEKGVSYDPDKFIYLGTAEHENHAVIYTRRELGLNSLERLRAAKGIRIGGQTVGHVSYVAGRPFGYFLDMKDPKFIVGYSAPEVDVALLAVSPTRGQITRLQCDAVTRIG